MNRFAARNMLVTGGLGFIGSNFIRYILSKRNDLQIINLDAETYAASHLNLKNLPNGHSHILIKGNINDGHLIMNLLQDYHIDTIINFAAESHVDRSISGSKIFMETNILGTHTLLETAKTFWSEKNYIATKRCRFYHISTDEIFGSCETIHDASFSERSPYHPRSPYAASKAASNHLVQSFFTTFSLPILISNCTNNYGPYQHEEKLIPKIITNCIKGENIPIYGDGSNIRDWLYVQDHCEAICQILEKGQPGEEYNIAGNCEVSNLDIAHMICDEMDNHSLRPTPCRDLITHVTDRPGHDWRYSLNCDKINQQLGWYPKTSLKDGLLKTIFFYLDKIDNLNKLSIVSS